MERKGGGARRGPFVGKRVSFASRLTEETMEKLVEAAERDNLSLSQKAEAVILRGLQQEAEFQRLFAPSLRRFETQMSILLGEDHTLADGWAERAIGAVSLLADDLEAGIKLRTSLVSADVPIEKPTVKAAVTPRGRIIDVGS